MKLAIVGSRDFYDYELLERAIIDFLPLENIDTIISGGARGADRLAELFAKTHQIPTLIFHADWNTYGKRAGYIRNADIINNADLVIAFWNGTSKGTAHSINLAKNKKPTRIIIFDKTNSTIVQVTDYISQ